jgi:UDP-N-acetyl-D-mannosaminuronic acid dehydrogenase
VERDKGIVASLTKGEPHFYEYGLETLLRKCLGKTLWIEDHVPEGPWDAYVICVGTPVNRKTRQVALEPLLRAVQEVALHLREEALVIVRSTVPVGATRNCVLPVLRQSVQDFSLAFCPERTIEGQALKELRELPQIVGGLDDASVDRAASIFSRATPTVVRVASLEAAEVIKLIDNTYRDINFAFANEVALMAGGIGVDAAELIRAANLGYRRNNIPVPGFVGGTCLSKDPYILVNSSQQFGYQFKLAALSRTINESLPLRFVQQLKERLEGVNKDIKTAKILVAGIAFKGQPDNDDVRDSPALDLLGHLRGASGCQHVVVHDYVVPPTRLMELGLTPLTLEEGMRGADAVVFMNNHPRYSQLDLQHVAGTLNLPAVILDGWHVLAHQSPKDIQGIVYGGLGVG